MRRVFVRAPVLFLSLHIWATVALAQQVSTQSPVEQELRAALCDIDSGDFVNAEKRLEKALQLDSSSIFAQRLMLGVVTRRVKLGNTSPENTALAREAIKALRQALSNSQFTSIEKAGIDRQILVLYAVISEEEQTNEIFRRVSDLNRTAKERSELYAILASKSWSCSWEITNRASFESVNVKNNKRTLSYRMPKDPKEFQKAMTCVARGMKEIENALKLDPTNESAWSYKVNLLFEASKLSEMENNLARKASYQKQTDNAGKRHAEIIALMDKARDEKWKKEEEELRDKQASRKPSAFKQPDDLDLLTKELTEYKAETPLDEAVEEYSFAGEPITLIVPVPIAAESGNAVTEAEPIAQPTPKGCFREIDGEAQVLEKRNWKSFSPAGEDLTVDLPDNVCSSAGGYIAASDGVMYSIFPSPRPTTQSDPTVGDGMLNSLIRTFVGFRSRTWVRGGNSFEVRLLRNETVNGQPSKSYEYALISCSKRKNGVLVVYTGKTHYYIVDISGARESEESVQRFLKSVIFK